MAKHAQNLGDNPLLLLLVMMVTVVVVMVIMVMMRRLGVVVVVLTPVGEIYRSIDLELETITKWGDIGVGFD
uniref:Uncharacterized protein n=1 Tax=Oryza meridionalis TaxID=40149 RepID=A0A0E0E460_9ORYZ